MYSRTTRYAFHLLGTLARRRDVLVSGEEMAGLTGIPANYLSKILNQLRKHGFVESQKGWGGGFRLDDRALGRPIMDVLVALEGAASSLDACAFGLPKCDGTNPCPLHDQWEQIRLASDHMLEQTRISDLAFDGR
ncbi:MAG: Rrf2 family transcriptional regulator [Acidobacteriota bacterium]|nr:Rrf2 family transcriptional regulator [Acidobacteriota bacterium]